MIDGVLAFGVTSALLAGGLAAVAAGVARIWRNPHVVRALWLVVLLKLISPPLFAVEWPLPAMTSSSASLEKSTPVLMQRAEAPAELATAMTAPPVDDSAVTAQLATFSLDAATLDAAKQATVAAWALGSLALLAIGIWRIARFHRMIGSALPASEDLAEYTARLARQFGLRGCPRLRLVQAETAPFLWPVGLRCTIVLPLSLVQSLDRGALGDVLLHELAHLRRGDHLVRWLEFFATVVQWWNPALWIARRELRQAEEACCDAWVAANFPGRRRAYARSLLAAAQLLLPCPSPSPLAAAAFSRRSLLTRRIEMLLHGRPTKRLPALGLALAGAIAAAALPAAIAWSRAEAAEFGPRSPGETSPAEVDEPAQESEVRSAPAALRFVRFAVAVATDDGQGLLVMRGDASAENETPTDGGGDKPAGRASFYNWQQVELFDSKGQAIEGDRARRAMAEPRMAVLISGTAALEDYASLWSALADGTPVIRVSSPGRRRAAVGPPARTLSIDQVGGGRVVEERARAAVADEPPAAMSIKSARLRIEHLQVRCVRLRKLAESNAIPQAELEDASIALDLAKQRLRELELMERRRETELRAAENILQMHEEANEAVPGAVPERKLKELSLQVDVAQARLAELRGE